MRKKSMVLGIVGGALAIFIASVVMTMGTTVFMLSYKNDPTYDENFEEIEEVETVEDDFFWSGYKTMVKGRLIILAGILAIVGGAFVKRYNVIAGILMFIAAVICLVTLWALISSILLLIGGRLAIAEKKSFSKEQIPADNENPAQRYDNTKSAVKVLGMTGTIIAYLQASFTAFVGFIAYTGFRGSDMKISEMGIFNPKYVWEMSMSTYGFLILAFGIISLLGASIGSGGVRAQKESNKLSGILMLIGGFMTLFSFGGFTTFVLLTLGGIFALYNHKLLGEAKPS